MQASSHRLVVVRHARAASSGPTDAARELTAGGRADAAAAGRWLAALALGPGGRGALVSTASRTRQTWAELAAAAGWDVDVVHDEALYAAGPDAALDLVRASAEDLGTLVVVGHNPTMGLLAQALDDGGGDDEASTAMAGHGFPTCTLAVLAVPGPWRDLAPGGAHLEAFHVARA